MKRAAHDGAGIRRDPYKKLENLAAAAALHAAFCNVCRARRTIKMTPAMAAGVVDELWTPDDLLAAI